jgi:hypothetical protein
MTPRAFFRRPSSRGLDLAAGDGIGPPLVVDALIHDRRLNVCPANRLPGGMKPLRLWRALL